MSSTTSSTEPSAPAVAPAADASATGGAAPSAEPAPEHAYRKADSYTSALLGVAVMLTGIYGMVIAFLIGGLSYGLACFEQVVVAGSLLLCSAVWAASGLLLRWHRRNNYVQVIVAGIAALVIWRMYAEPLDLVLAAIKETYPAIYEGPTVAVAVWGVFLAATCLRLLLMRADPQRGGFTPLGGGFALVAPLALAVLPFKVLPEHLHASAQEDIAQVKREFLLGQRPASPMLGGMIETILGDDSGLLYESRLENAFAELEALQASGVKLVLMRASGLAYERDAEAIKAIVRRARDLGMKVALADMPSPKHSHAYGVASWYTFQQNHRKRVRWYVETCKPDVMFVCTSALGYFRRGEIAMHYNFHQHPQRWEDHLRELGAWIRRNHPRIAVGVNFEPWIPEDKEIHRRMLKKPEIDILGFSCLSVAQLEKMRRINHFYGHPEKFGQRQWITGSFFGRPSMPERHADLEKLWFEATVGWSQHMAVDALLVRPGGTFVPGGYLGALQDGSLAEKWKAGGAELSELGEFWGGLTGKFGGGWKDPRSKEGLEQFIPAGGDPDGEAPPLVDPEDVEGPPGKKSPDKSIGPGEDAGPRQTS